MVTKNDAWTKIEGILIRVGINEKNIAKIESLIESNYVTKDQYEPIKMVVYGLVGIILVAVLGAIIKLVIIG